MVEVMKRSDCEKETDWSHSELEEMLDFMSNAYREKRGDKAFEELSDFAKDIVTVTGKAIEELDAPQKLFLLCYFACSWIMSYEMNSRIYGEQINNKIVDLFERFVEDNADNPMEDEELFAKFIKEVLNG